jgi:hypothetical protein
MRDCKHGRQTGKCADCEVEELCKRVDELEGALVNIRRHWKFIGGDMADYSTITRIANKALKDGEG